jgi:hypothetical protein
VNQSGEKDRRGPLTKHEDVPLAVELCGGLQVNSLR